MITTPGHQVNHPFGVIGVQLLIVEPPRRGSVRVNGIGEQL
jgi:hypothetical protein